MLKSSVTRICAPKGIVRNVLACKFSTDDSLWQTSSAVWRRASLNDCNTVTACLSCRHHVCTCRTGVWRRSFATAEANEVNKTDEEKGKAKKRTEVTYDEVVSLLSAGASRFVDVRDANERAASGSLPGSVSIPLGDLRRALQMEDDLYASQYGVAKPNKDGSDVIFFSLSSVQSSAAVELAHKMGFKKARSYPGGWQEWSSKKANRPTP